MNLKQIYQYARGSHSYYDFENIIAQKMFNAPKSASTRNLTDKLLLTDGSDAIEFAEWIHSNRWQTRIGEPGCWMNLFKGQKVQYATSEQLYELYKKGETNGKANNTRNMQRLHS